MKPRSYGFDGQINFVNGHAPDPQSTFEFLRHRVPNFSGIRKTDLAVDKTGIDYYVDRNGLPPLGVDLKLRDSDFSVNGGPDDLALETWSVIGRKIGWTRDPSKATDFILWYWRDTGRFFLASFPALCCTFERYWEQWRERFKPPRVQDTPPENGNEGWQSECIFVPRSVVEKHLASWSNGYARITGPRAAAAMKVKAAPARIQPPTAMGETHTITRDKLRADKLKQGWLFNPKGEPE